MEAALQTQVEPLSVSEYAARITRAVRQVGSALVEGEVQRISRSGGGVLFFDLSDGDAKLSCKVFRRQLTQLSHQPKVGDLVKVAVEKPDFWAVAGKLDLVVADIELAGAGELLRRRADLIKRLEAEGLCDPARRKPIPLMPRAIGVIAGKGSDAMSDVIRAVHDRFPAAHLVTCESLVQGVSAPRSVIDTIARMQEHPLVDVIVIARGGGSVQDLIAFDDERLCRAIFACDLPVVTAIGHTDNVPVCNHVAHSAFTPSRSAELVVPSLAELDQKFDSARKCIGLIPERIERRQEQVEGCTQRLRVPELAEARHQRVRDLGQRLQASQDAFFSLREQTLAQSRAAIDSAPHRARVTVSGHEQLLADVRPRLEGASVRVEAARQDVAEQARQLRTGTRRQLEDHERDYSRALERLQGDIKEAAWRRLASDPITEQGQRLRRGIQRQLGDHERNYRRALDRIGTEILERASARLDGDMERVTRSSELVDERVDRRVREAEQSLGHLTAVIEARDFRRQGFVLATDSEGAAIASVAVIAAGSRLNLQFRDGRAQALIENVKEDR